MDDLKTVYIDDNEQIFLDGKAVKNVTAYRLENSAGGTAELTISFPVKIGRVGSGSKMKKLDVLKSITDEKKFSELVFDLIKTCKEPESLANLLAGEVADDGIQTLESIAQSGYPLSFERRQ